MLKSQGISLAPQKTSCAVNSSLIARATKDKSDAQSGQPWVGGVSLTVGGPIMPANDIRLALQASARGAPRRPTARM